MFTDKVDLQQIRKTVLRSQLLALDAQAQAIYYLGTEHFDGIDLGRNPEIYLTVQAVKDVAANARTIVDQAKSLSAADVLSKLQALQALANSVVARTEEACAHAQADADKRLAETLGHTLNQGENASEVPLVPTDTKHLKARAGIACHSAELDQHHDGEEGEHQPAPERHAFQQHETPHAARADRRPFLRDPALRARTVIGHFGARRVAPSRRMVSPLR